MNIRSLRTGVAALALATAPLKSSAQTFAKEMADSSIKTEILEMRNISKPKTNVKLGFDFSTKDLLNVRTNEPRATVTIDAVGTGGEFFARPKVAVGRETFEVATPMGFQTEIAPNTTFEIGANPLGIRGFHNKEVYLQSDVSKVQQQNLSSISRRSFEMNQNAFAGIRYKNQNVNAGVQAMVGNDMLLNGCNTLDNANDIGKNGVKIVKDHASSYYGFKGDVEVTPFKNKNVSINADGGVFFNSNGSSSTAKVKGPEASIGVGYKF